MMSSATRLAEGTRNPSQSGKRLGVVSSLHAAALLIMMLLPNAGGWRIVKAEAQYDWLYVSQNLSGHEVTAECNPGGGTSCPCSEEDVSLVSFHDYGEITSNVEEVNTWVNAIGYRKFVEVFPNGDSISLGVYKYVGQVQLPVLPAPDLGQRQNPQAVHFMIQLWDGRNELYQSDKSSLEGAIYWDLNPWTQDFGKIKVYTGLLNLVDTGIVLLPDLDWHTLELVVDLERQEYLSITIDSESKDLQDLELARVFHPDWGSEVAFSITTESMAAWPGEECEYVFTWTTRFRDLELGTEGSVTGSIPFDLPSRGRVGAPDAFALYPNYPNSFRRETWIPFHLGSASHVTVRIYETSGRLVRELDLGRLPAGAYLDRTRAAWWDGRDEGGKPVSSGLYLYQIRAGSFTAARQMTILE